MFHCQLKEKTNEPDVDELENGTMEGEASKGVLIENPVKASSNPVVTSSVFNDTFIIGNTLSKVALCHGAYWLPVKAFTVFCRALCFHHDFV